MRVAKRYWRSELPLDALAALPYLSVAHALPTPDVTHVAGLDNTIADALSRLAVGATGLRPAMAPNVRRLRAETGSCCV